MTHSDAEDNADQKMNLYFTYKSQNSLFLTVKTQNWIWNAVLNLE